MRMKEVVGAALAVVLLLFVAGELAAQCEECDLNTGGCVPTSEDMVCIFWVDDPVLGTGCDDSGAPPGSCSGGGSPPGGGDGFASTVDITGLPALAASLAGLVDADVGWIRRPCDDAVLRFAYAQEEIVWIARASERLSL